MCVHAYSHIFSLFAARTLVFSKLTWHRMRTSYDFISFLSTSSNSYFPSVSLNFFHRVWDLRLRLVTSQLLCNEHRQPYAGGSILYLILIRGFIFNTYSQFYNHINIYLDNLFRYSYSLRWLPHFWFFWFWFLFWRHVKWGYFGDDTCGEPTWTSWDCCFVLVHV